MDSNSGAAPAACMSAQEDTPSASAEASSSGRPAVLYEEALTGNPAWAAFKRGLEKRGAFKAGRSSASPSLMACWGTEADAGQWECMHSICIIEAKAYD